MNTVFQQCCNKTAETVTAWHSFISTLIKLLHSSPFLEFLLSSHCSDQSICSTTKLIISSE